jgi:hypothetical protein
MVEFVETGLSSDVIEYDGSIVHKSARCDGPRLGVFHSGMCSAG